MKIIAALILIIGGVLFVKNTYDDEKNYTSILSTSYVMHFGGYIGGLGAIIEGVLLLFEVITGNQYFY